MLEFKASLFLWLRDVRELLALLLLYINILLGFGLWLLAKRNRG